jgi:cytochrome b561
MGWKNTSNHYGTLSMAFHWLMLALLIAVFASIELRSMYPKGSDPREAIKALHFMLGLLVLLLVFIRLAIRVMQPVPNINPPMSPKQKLMASTMHGLLYLMMIFMPILGWFVLSAAGKDILFFGLQLPSLIAVDKGLAEQLEDLHKTIGEVAYYLIGLHAIAALFHHYIQKDNTLTRMLPWGK